MRWESGVDDLVTHGLVSYKTSGCVFAVGGDWRRFGREDSEAAADRDSGLSFPARARGSGSHSAACLRHPCHPLVSEQGNTTAHNTLATTQNTLATP